MIKKINNQLNTNQTNINNIIYSNVKNSLYYAIGITCNSTNCLGPNKCTDKTKCKCSAENANYKVKSDSSNIYCNYSRKHQKTAFYLELFLPVGSSQFYLGNYVYASLKLTFSIIFLVMVMFNIFYDFEKNTFDYKLFRAILYFLLMCFVMWYITDCILLGINYFTDLYKIPLLSW